MLSPVAHSWSFKGLRKWSGDGVGEGMTSLNRHNDGIKNGVLFVCLSDFRIPTDAKELDPPNQPQ